MKGYQLDTKTDRELQLMLRYERDVEQLRKNHDRVTRSLKKIAAIQAEQARRAAQAQV